MKNFLIILLLTCVCLQGQAQVNFVKNPSLEEYTNCPDAFSQIYRAKYWSNAIDSDFEFSTDYLNECSNLLLDKSLHIPDNSNFYQLPHFGRGMAAANFFYDKTLPAPPSPLPFNYRDYLQGRLFRNLENGKSYCVSFWVNLTETSGYYHNKIGAYLDNGSINSIVDTPGEEITAVLPQIKDEGVIDDTLNWVRIQGSFIANGDETYITIGVFLENSSVVALPSPWSSAHYSYYLIDDISVILIDLEADAGKDSHAEPGKPVQIGRLGDTTTQGLDCKWYKKGALIDSGAVIKVNGSAIVGNVDTYVVVQTICGLVKTDTVTVKTVPLGMKEWDANQTFTVYPNPSNGAFTITQTSLRGTMQSIHAKVYDLLGRVVYQQTIAFNNNTASIKANTGSGFYILELTGEEGNVSRQRIVFE